VQSALLGSMLGSLAESMFPTESGAALLQFPTTELKNTYFLVAPSPTRDPTSALLILLCPLPRSGA